MIRDKDIERLKNHARYFAMRMDDHAIEKVIVEFVEVKLERDNSRRERSQEPCHQPP